MDKVYMIIDDTGMVSGFSIDIPTGFNYASNQLDMDTEAPMLPTDVVVEDNIARLRTNSELTAEVTRLQAEYDANQYQRDRKVKYDALNQFELISNDAINGTTTPKVAILAIKAEIPKPTGE